ncbi:MAG: peptidase M75 family protein [Propionibacteriaceae bacterium]|jgi:iron uptake system component EfeO|nr:peptidase M75 family protein [Propionibacteriaceae bacterium]
MKTPALLLTATLFALAGCTDNAPASTPGDLRALSVTASDSTCGLSAQTAPSGTLTFSVTNTGTTINEFYLLAADGLRIVAEVENIGPGLTRDLVLSAPAGSYVTACKPGMVGAGIRAPFVVSDSGEPVGPTGDDAALVAAADALYGAYVRDQAEQLLSGTQEFVAAYTAGKDDQARALYAPTRVHWERIETVAESFGDLDPKMDLREADLEEGQEWTGWHRLEKDLWPARAKGYQALKPAERATYAEDLLANTRLLVERTRTMSFSADAIANGAKGLLDEVATGKVTGEEEYWSRTDLWDFQANVDGARVAWEGLRDLLKRKNAALDTQIETAFTGLQALLDRHRSGDGFVTYDKLSPAEVKSLSDAVNTLSEPLSKLASAVLA